MKNKLGITEGEWSVEKYEIDSSGRACYRISTYIIPKKSDLEANAKLISDAGTTANKCGKLPSDLLKERDELLYKAPEELQEIIKNGAFPESHLSSTLVIDLEATLDKIYDFFEAKK